MKSFLRGAFRGTTLFLVFSGISITGYPAPPDRELQGTVRLDGSSTVFPISEAVAEEFQLRHPRVRVTVGVSGTGGGFKKFLLGETDINDASRPIKPPEREKAEKNGIEFIELPVAFDGIVVVVNPENDFVGTLTVEELKRIWEPGSTVKSWNQVRPGWPERPIILYGPGHDSGTFDYFTEAIVGKSGACREDFTASEDDNILVRGVAGDRNALGFFGFAYYANNRDQLRAVPIDSGTGPVAPSTNTINDGTYRPLSRPLFIYVSRPAAVRPEVDTFVRFYLEHAAELAAEVGYVSLPKNVYELVQDRFLKRIDGSIYSDVASTIGMRLEDLLARN